MSARQLASGLGFTEGPLVLPDGGIVFCDGTQGTLLLYDGVRVSEYARASGGPNGTALGADGEVYVARMGSWAPDDDEGLAGAIVRVRPSGEVEHLFSDIAGIPLLAPNDVAFGPDGRLYFTDSGSGDHTAPTSPGRIFAVSEQGSELLLELAPVYPNGIAFDPEGRLLWTETYTRRIFRLEDSGPRLLHQLPEDYLPDGMAVAADGRIYVATVTSRGITVVSAEGERLDHLEIGLLPTNCAFRGGALVVTAVVDLSGKPGTGTLCEIETDAEPLVLWPGRL